MVLADQLVVPTSDLQLVAAAVVAIVAVVLLISVGFIPSSR